MVNSTYTVKLDNGKEIVKRFVSGNVVRVNEEANRPLSFDLAINKGKDREPEYINRVQVDKDARFAGLVKEFKPGQQLFCEINVVTSDKKDSNGKPYLNYWLQCFDYGKSPKKAVN